MAAGIREPCLIWKTHSSQSAGTDLPDRLEELLGGASFSTYELLLSSCGRTRSLAQGKRIHEHIVQHGQGDDRYLSNLLVQMYGKCGSPQDARLVFDQIAVRNVFSWTLMIRAYAQNGHNPEALHLFWLMNQLGEASPDRITFIEILGVCTNLKNLSEGKKIDEWVVASGFAGDTVAATAVFNMYAKCGCIGRARYLFECLSEKSLVSWNTMISAYAQVGHTNKALKTFRKLDIEGMQPDGMSYSAVLPAVTRFQDGVALHERITCCGYGSSAVVCNPLIDFYSRFTCLEQAREIFDAIEDKNVVSWNTMVTVYAEHGHVQEALEMFSEMCRSSVLPNRVSFSAVLQACNRGGLVEQSCRYLLLMREYGVSPCKEHYYCVVDVLGRAGRLEDAEQLVLQMNFPVDACVWRSLLGACKLHGDVDRGVRVARKVMEMDPDECSAYTLLCYFYAREGLLDDLDRVRKLMKERESKSDRRKWGQLKCGLIRSVVRKTRRMEAKQINKKLKALNVHMESFRSDL